MHRHNHPFRRYACGRAVHIGDTKLRRRRKRKNKNGEWEDYFEEVDIVNIKPGDEILTFNEHSGRFVVSKVKQLADMGVKTIYKLTTASGKPFVPRQITLILSGRLNCLPGPLRLTSPGK